MIFFCYLLFIIQIHILTKKVISFKKYSYIFGRFFATRVRSDQFSHFTIRIQIQPNYTYPTGSESTTLHFFMLLHVIYAYN